MENGRSYYFKKANKFTVENRKEKRRNHYFEQSYLKKIYQKVSDGKWEESLF